MATSLARQAIWGVPFTNAAANNDMKAMEDILAHGLDVDWLPTSSFQQTVMTHPMTALHLAAFLGHSEMVRCLIHHGATVDILDRKPQDSGGFDITPLAQAAINSHFEVMEILVQAGASVHAVDGVLEEQDYYMNNGGLKYHLSSLSMLTAIIRNVKSGEEVSDSMKKCIILLLDQGMDINDVPSPAWSPSLIKRALKTGNNNLIQFILQLSPRIGEYALDPYVALGCAAKLGKLNIVSCLLPQVPIENGVLVERTSTPLCIAAGGGLYKGSIYPEEKVLLKVMRKLISHGFPINGISEEYECTPLHKAAAALEPNIELVKFLLRRGAQPLARTGRITRKGHREQLILGVGLASGSFVAAQTPLHLSVKRASTEVVKRLIEANPEASHITDDDGLTPLHACAESICNSAKMIASNNSMDPTRSARTEILQLLIDNGANVDAQTNDGFTAMHYLTTKKNNNVARNAMTALEALFAADADPHLPNIYGKTAVTGVGTLRMKNYLLVKLEALEARHRAKTVNSKEKDV